MELFSFKSKFSLSWLKTKEKNLKNSKENNKLTRNDKLTIS